MTGLAVPRCPIDLIGQCEDFVAAAYQNGPKCMVELARTILEYVTRKKEIFAGPLADEFRLFANDRNLQPFLQNDKRFRVGDFRFVGFVNEPKPKARPRRPRLYRIQPYGRMQSRQTFRR